MAQVGPEGPSRGVRAFAVATICPSPAWRARKAPGQGNTLRSPGRSLSSLAAPPAQHPAQASTSSLPTVAPTQPIWAGAGGPCALGAPAVLGTTKHHLGGRHSLTCEEGVGRICGTLHAPAQPPHADVVPAPSPCLEGGGSCKSPGSAPPGHHASRGLHGHSCPLAMPAKGCLGHLAPVPAAHPWLSPQRFSSEPSSQFSTKLQTSPALMHSLLSQATCSAPQGLAPTGLGSAVEGFSDGETPRDGERW